LLPGEAKNPYSLQGYPTFFLIMVIIPVTSYQVFGRLIIELFEANTVVIFHRRKLRLRPERSLTQGRQMASGEAETTNPRAWHSPLLCSVSNQMEAPGTKARSRFRVTR
jgi:hypothetical protein